MNRLRTPIVIAAVSVVAGCSLVGAGAPSGVQDEAARQQEDQPTVAEVSNDSWFNIRVYIADQGRRERLGSVSSYESSSFEVPTDIVRTSGEIQLLADPVGSTVTYRSSPVLIGAGQLIQWTVQNDPSQTYSSITVR